MNFKRVVGAHRTSREVYIVCVASFIYVSSMKVTLAITSDVNINNVSNCVDRMEAVPNIIGGIKAALGSFPYQVSIQQRMNLGDNICSGCIVSREWVVTAAHCVFNVQLVINSFVIAAAFTHMSSKNILYFSIADCVTHPDFSYHNFINDVAMVRVNPSFSASRFIRALRATTSAPESKTLCLVSGWGSMDEAGRKYPDVFMVTELKIKTNGTCRKTYPEFNPASQMCAAEDGHDVGYLDSGSPLVCDGVLFGIMSYGSTDCPKGCPTVFSSIYHYREWMDLVKKSKTPEHQKRSGLNGSTTFLLSKNVNLFLLLIYFIL